MAKFLFCLTVITSSFASHKELSLFHAKQLIIRFEGYKDQCYLDSGKLAIGYGFHGLDKCDITKEEAIEFLDRKVTSLYYFIVSKLSTNLTPKQTGALISLVYNVGRTAFTKSKLYVFLKENNIESAALELDDWISKDPKYHKGLKNRREYEKQYLLSYENH